MPSIKLKYLTIILLIVFSDIVKGKLSENKTSFEAEVKTSFKFQQDGALLLLADEIKITLDKYLFGICPPTFKMLNKSKDFTTQACDLDLEHQDLAGRLATLSLRAHAASRGECSRLGAALANTFGELARTAAVKHSATAEANKKQRKMSKAQKLKIVANQRKALAVKKKAAAVAAAAAAKTTTSA